MVTSMKLSERYLSEGFFFSATKMAQQMKVLATKPYGQSAISEIHRVRRENQANSYKLSLDLDKSIFWMPMSPTK